MKKVLCAFLGLLHGFFGSYWALLGYAFAFPGTSKDSKDYEEDMFTSPIGFVMMLIWLIVMITAVLKLKKNKSELAAFLATWAVGTAALIACGVMRVDLSAMLSF